MWLKVGGFSWREKQIDLTGFGGFLGGMWRDGSPRAGNPAGRDGGKRIVCELRENIGMERMRM